MDLVGWTVDQEVGRCYALLKCLCIKNSAYTFSSKIETLVFPMYEDHIIFALTGEKGVEISAYFEALGANF